MANYIPERKYMLILDLLQDGKSQREISKIIKVAKGTVRKIYQFHFNFCEEECGEKHYPRKGGYWDHKKHLL